MATKIGDYIAKFSADVEGFVQNLQKTVVSSDSMTGSIVKAQLSLKAIEATVKAGVAALAAITTQAANYGDALFAASQKTGVQVEQLAKLKYGAQMSGVSFEELAKSAGVLSKNMDAAATGGQAQAEAFARLGIEVTNTDGTLRPIDAVMGDVAEKFKGMDDGAQKAAIAQELFGKSGAALIPFLNEGRDGLAAMGDEAERLGLVMSTKAAKAGDAFNDSMDRLSGATTGLSNALGEALLPPLTRIADAITGVVVQASGWIKANKVIVDSLIDLGQNILTVLVDFVARGIESVSRLIDFAAKAAYAFGFDGLAGKLETAGRVGHEMALGLKNANDKLADSYYQTEEASKAITKHTVLIEQDTEAQKKWATSMQKAVDDIATARDKLDKESLEFHKFTVDRFEEEADQAKKFSIKLAESIVGAYTKAREASASFAAKAEEDFRDVLDRDLDYKTKQWQKEQELNARQREDHLKYLEGLDDAAKKSAESYQRIWEQATANVTAGIADGLAAVVFHAESFEEAMVSIAKSTAENMFKAFLTGLLSPLTSALSTLGREIATSIGGGGGGGVGGAGGSFGGGGSGIGGGLFGGALGAAGGGFLLGYGITSRIMNGDKDEYGTNAYFRSHGYTYHNGQWHSPAQWQQYGPRLTGRPAGDERSSGGETQMGERDIVIQLDGYEVGRLVSKYQSKMARDGTILSPIYER